MNLRDFERLFNMGISQGFYFPDQLFLWDGLFWVYPGGDFAAFELPKRLIRYPGDSD
jgi:hypothetical protein